MEAEGKSWIKKLLPSWFDSNDQEHTARTNPLPHPETIVGDTQEGKPPGAAQEFGESSALAKKLTMLKSALEFNSNVASQAAAIQSTQQLLVFVHEVMLYKFVRLGELGLLGENYAQALDLVSKHLEAALVNPESPEPKIEQGDLVRENELLKEQLTSLRSEYVKSGIVSERELQLDEECTYLKRRIRELNSLLRIGKKRISRLVAAQQDLESLQARNSLLNSKVEHQTKLLRLLAADKPEQQKLVLNAEKLEQENKQLKDQLESQFAMLQQLPEESLAGSPMENKLKALLAETDGLFQEFHDKEDRLETLTADHPEGNLIDNLDRLQEDNIQLKNLLKNKELLQNLLDHAGRGEDHQERLADFLREGNAGMKELLAVKTQQFKVVQHDSETRPLVRALLRAKHDNRQLKRDNLLKQSACEELNREKALLQSQVKDLKPFQKQSRRLQTQLTDCQQLLEAMRLAEFRYKELKKKHSVLRIQHERALVEKQQMEQKMARLNTEYEFLVSEYEKLF